MDLKEIAMQNYLSIVEEIDFDAGLYINKLPVYEAAKSELESHYDSFFPPYIGTVAEFTLGALADQLRAVHAVGKSNGVFVRLIMVAVHERIVRLTKAHGPTIMGDGYWTPDITNLLERIRA